MEIKITEQQKKIIETPYDKVTVQASAGTSKTFLLIERIKFLVNGGADPTKIVAITFTRNAAQEIAKRLGNIKIGYIGTVHALANYLLLSNGVDTSNFLEEGKFDKLFELVDENPYCTDFEISNLLLDEAQDSNYAQFRFMFELLQPERFMIFFDLKQSIYGFQGASPKVVEKFSKQGDIHNYYITENFRSSRAVFEQAKRRLENRTSFLELAHPVRKEQGIVEYVDYNLNTIYETIKNNDNYGDWFVLAKTNKEVDSIREYLNRRGIPAESFKQGNLNNDELSKKMKENTVKVLTIHSSKGLESKNVILMAFRIFNKEDDRLMYVGMTRAKDSLIYVKCPNKKQVSSWE